MIKNANSFSGTDKNELIIFHPCTTTMRNGQAICYS
jgi:hypothetical protein